MMEEATEQEVTVDVGTTEEPQKETEGGEQQPEEGQKEPEAAAEPEQPVNPFSDAGAVEVGVSGQPYWITHTCVAMVDRHANASLHYHYQVGAR